MFLYNFYHILCQFLRYLNAEYCEVFFCTWKSFNLIYFRSTMRFTLELTSLYYSFNTACKKTCRYMGINFNPDREMQQQLYIRKSGE